MIKINLRNFLIFTIVIFLYLIIKNFLKAKEHLSNNASLQTLETTGQYHTVMDGCYVQSYYIDKDDEKIIVDLNQTEVINVI